MSTPIQPAIQSLLNQLIAEDAERGLQVAVYLRGELVVNASAGIADPVTGRAVNNETLFPVFSTTKGIAATLVHLLVERGKIAYDTRIAEVWPEFAAHGKEGITLRQALNHTAGLPNMPLGIGHRDLCDWETMSRAIADLEPISAPGMEYAYHAITYSWIVGETARRVDGRSFPQLLREEVCVPLGLTESLYVGIPDEAESRVAILEANAATAVNQTLPHDATPKAIPDLVQPLHEWMNRPDARRACIPASTGIMTAQAIARHYAALLPGGVDGIELLPPERIRLATEPQWPGHHPAGSPPSGHFLGYGGGNHFSAPQFGHGGFGGSDGFAVPQLNLAFGFTRNRFVSDTTLPRIVATLKELIED
ncbi:MAG TPA: serine hydrolase domain-containing protein [Candidatus Methylacidiphilales bacterium]